MIVRLCVAFGVIVFAAVTVSTVVPVAVGVPAINAVPLPWSVKVSPAGITGVSVNAGIGSPVVVTAKDPAALSVK
jgi:hypothetical protein